MISAEHPVHPHSFLFVPATRPDRFRKARESSADIVIVDLEDAIGEGDKSSARKSLAASSDFDRAFVRINSVSTEHFEDDVRACLETGWVTDILVPMVESAADVMKLQNLLTRDMGIAALIETARGIQSANEIAESGVSRLYFGSADYAAQIRATPSKTLYSYPQSRLVVASAAAGLPAPVDGPTLKYLDDDLLRDDLEVARSLGMGGKLCIHPSQVPVVNRAFHFNADELVWAQEVVAAASKRDGEVFTMDGEMIDAPVVARARGILET